MGAERDVLRAKPGQSEQLVSVRVTTVIFVPLAMVFLKGFSWINMRQGCRDCRPSEQMKKLKLDET